jgi:integrase
VIADLHGAAEHIRTLPIPFWVQEALNRWTEASGIKNGCLLRAINKSGKIWGDGMTPKMLWEIVKRAAEAAGIEKLAPRDMRRTCVRLCHLAGGELDRYNSSSVTSPFRQRNITSAANKSSDSL